MHWRVAVGGCGRGLTPFTPTPPSSLFFVCGAHVAEHPLCKGLAAELSAVGKEPIPTFHACRDHLESEGLIAARSASRASG